MTWLCSWSGGKDSALALHRARALLGDDARLLTMFTEDGQRSRSHGLPVTVLQAQADALGMPLMTASASWNDYTPVFVALLRRFRAEGGSAVVFGDIDLQDHRDWCLRACAEADLDCVHPLWGEPRESLVREVIAVGIDARVVAVRDGVLAPERLGRRLDHGLLDDLAAAKVDLAGEQGEYHTVVTDGPGFRRPLDLASGDIVLRDGYWFLDVDVEEAEARDEK